jgi:hypothetical protein
VIDPDEASGPLTQLASNVVRYIIVQREKYRPSATPLSVEQVVAMQRYFTPELLAAVRLKRLINERLEAPSFELMGLDSMSQTAFALMAATTFVDVIVASVPIDDDLLFHELVHAEQYRQLGVQRFAEAYVRGAMERGTYHGIPLEEQAYMLGTRLFSNPEESFSVTREVASWMSEGRF